MDADIRCCKEILCRNEEDSANISFFMETDDEQLSSLFNKIIPFDKISINMYLIVVKLVKIVVLIYIKSKFNYELYNFPLTNCHFSVRFSISCSSFRYPFHF